MPKLILGIGAALLLLAGLALWLDQPVAVIAVRTAPNQETDITAGALYATQFTDIAGKQQELGQWQHRLMVINFWATWCAPCREEMPMLARMQEKYHSQGLQIVGIAVDSPENVTNFAQNYPTTYPLLLNEPAAIEFSRRLGNRLGLLPFTVAVKPGGEIVFTRIGIVTEQEMVTLAAKYLQK